MGSGIKGPYTGTRGSVNLNDGLKKELITNLAETLIEVLNKKISENLQSTKQMPNYDKSFTPIEKFSKYSLELNNPNNHGKAEAYKRGLGFDKSNAEQLCSAIHNAIVSGKYEPYDIERGKTGIKYKYKIPVKGPNGKTKNVIAVYQIDDGQENPRMVTNYLDKEKNQND